MDCHVASLLATTKERI